MCTRALVRLCSYILDTVLPSFLIAVVIPVTLITTSVLTLTVVSIERFLAIVFPLRRGGWTLKMTWPIIFVIWVIACG